MERNREIITLLNTFGHPVQFNQYDGTIKPYFVFSIELEEPVLHGDDVAVALATSYLIRFFCPKTFNYLSLKYSVAQKLEEQGFTYPQITEQYNASSQLMQINFETEKELILNG